MRTKKNKKFNLKSALSLHFFSQKIRRRYGQVLLISLITFILGAFYSVKLFKNLRTDIEELLPENAPSVRDLRSVANRMGGLNHLSIVIESSDKEASFRFVQDLTKKLREQPKDIVDRVEDNILEIRDFFYKNRSLYIDLEDWEAIENFVKERFKYERRKRYKHSLLGPLDEAKQPEFNIQALKEKYARRAASSDKFPDGYFISRDGKTRVVLVRLPGKVTDVKANERLSNIAHKIVEELNPKSYAPDLIVGFDGDVQNVVEEHHALVEDLISSTIIVTVLVSLSLLFYFRSLMASLILTVALFVGTAWTFGLSYFLVGYLNANTAFMSSIVLGNGINFGIILMARYLEERRRGIRYTTALSRAIGFTSQATWTAALAAGLAYLSLILTEFRGFNQFGIIGFVGMVLCWLASFTTMPALIIWAERKKFLKINMKKENPIFTRWIGKLVEKYYRPIFIFVLVSIFVSVFFVTQFSKDSIEMDLTKLRSKESLEHGSGFWGKKVDQVFEQYLTPTLIMTQNESDTLVVHQALLDIKNKEGALTPIDDIKIINDYLPKDQAKKIRIINRIKEMLPESVIEKLDPKDKKLVRELLPNQLPDILKPQDLPRLLKIPFQELDGTIGKIVHAYPKFEHGEFWDGNEVIRFTQRLREAIKRSGVGAVVAGQAPISADLIASIKDDGPRATVFALCSVIILVLFIFPSFKQARSVLGSLLLGVLWMLAIMGAFKLKINFLNFIALPITFGIGVDYAVNIFSRFNSDGGKSLQKAIEHSGGAVALCSYTTIVGYGSLLIASNQAFVSFGRLAIIGEVTCLFAAIIALPAAWKFFKQNQ